MPASEPDLSLAGLARTHPIALTLFAATLVSGVLLLAPGLDIAASALFYRGGVGFPLEASPFWRDVRELGMAMTRLVSGLLIGVVVLKLIAPARPLLLRPRTALFLIATQTLGSGLIVNGILKEFWGRARPRQTDLFGGAFPYTPPWAISDACDTNCSFTSGEAASSFWLVAFAFVVPPPWRTATLIAALAWATVMSVNRIAFGGHYLSDVVLSWAIMLLVMLVLRDAILLRPSPAFDDRLERALAAPARWLTRNRSRTAATDRTGDTPS